MSKRCEVCKKGSTKGARRSHSNKKTLRRQNRNLQTRKIGGVKFRVCTKCLRTLAKNEK